MTSCASVVPETSGCSGWFLILTVWRVGRKSSCHKCGGSTCPHCSTDLVTVSRDPAREESLATIPSAVAHASEVGFFVY